jgi:hypothetical protein
LGIIWLASLLPIRWGRRSPSSSVEEFERKMSLLADTNRTSPGRYVLMPRKGERFMGPRDREHVRVRRRRRTIFMVLLEASGLSLLIGLFPPLRAMLYLTAVLGTLLLAYSLLLVKLKADEEHLQQLRRRYDAERSGLGRLPRRTGAAGNGNGHVPAVGQNGFLDHGPRLDAVDLIVDDDVHVIVHRSGDVPIVEAVTAGR